MKPTSLLFCFLMSTIVQLTTGTNCDAQLFMPIFDGKTFAGWQGDTANTFKIEEHSIAGGSLTTNVSHNEFLATVESYRNFELKLKFKLVGTGYANAGIQFRSKRSTNPAYEMIGYQADLGNGYWASLYDESRRNKTLVKPDSVEVSKILKMDDWNDYEVICKGRNIRIILNGKETVNYTEDDKSIPQEGLIALQIHGGGKAKVYYKEIFLKKLK